MPDFTYEIIIDEPPEFVFQSFSNPAILAKWWGPSGFTNTFEKFEFSRNGDWIFTMHGPDGANYPNKSLFTEIIPNSLIKIRHDCEPYFDLAISLLPDASGTRLTWISDFDNKGFVERLRDFLEGANRQNLERLQTVIAEHRRIREGHSGASTIP
jgi:uncharacterized protein YndB with AHSA1/START domain